MDCKEVMTLFDIDGTLVRGARCHYQAFIEAVKLYYGMEEDISGINYAGKTDPQILREVLELGDFDERVMVQNFQNCLDYMAEYYVKNVHRENIETLGGVNELLIDIKQKGVVLGLVTGNLEPIAYAKLGRVDLDDYFPFGGFGSDNPDRSILVRMALERARNHFGFGGDRVFVIGDTPRDVAAAHISHLTTIAVATGRYCSQELEDCGADFVVQSLRNKNEILEIILP